MTQLSLTASLRRLRGFLAVTLASLLLLPAPVAAAQAASAMSAAAAPAPRELHIVILDGEGALNNIRQRTAREPIVQVQDENHKPVAGAIVLFFIHSGSTGAGATFGGATSLSVTTGADGEARATGLRPNNSSGQYAISVEATFGAMVTTAVINQANELGMSTSTGKLVRHGLSPRNWLIIGGVAVAAGVATAVVLTRNKGAVITTGKGTVAP